jgi:hypothetical protein
MVVVIIVWMRIEMEVKDRDGGMKWWDFGSASGRVMW